MYAVTHTAAGMHKVTIVEHRNLSKIDVVECNVANTYWMQYTFSHDVVHINGHNLTNWNSLSIVRDW